MRQSSLAALLLQGHTRPFLAEEEGVKPTVPEELCGRSSISLGSQSTQKRGSFSKSGIQPEPQEALPEAGCGRQALPPVDRRQCFLNLRKVPAPFPRYLLHWLCDLLRWSVGKYPRVSVYVGGTFKHDLEIHSFYVSETSADTLQLQAAFQKPLPACLPACAGARA